MAVKDGHPLNPRVGEVHDTVDGTAVWNIHSIQPRRMCERGAVFCIGQEVDLVYVERMYFPSSVDNTPMLISTYASACHRTCIRRKLSAIDVEAVLVLREGDNEVRCNLLQQLNVDRLVKWQPVNDIIHLLRRGIRAEMHHNGNPPIC